MNRPGILKGKLIYLSLGSNLGDKIQNLKGAIDLMGNLLGNQLVVSRIYESQPWGYSSKNHFYNCCLSMATRLEPIPLMEEILSIERILGRKREVEGYTDRLIDIDLLLYEMEVVDHPRLTVPHPSMELRRFVLEPLSEIAPNLVHPINGLTVTEMLNRCPDLGVITPV